MGKVIGLILLTAAVAGCAKPALYQPMRDDVGYGQRQLEENHYTVWFVGNSATPRETVEDYVLYRCAELTLEKAYDYFVLSNRSTQGEHRPGSGVSLGIGGFRLGGSGGISLGVGTGIPVGGDKKYFGEANVLLMKGQKPANDPNAFDAREVKKNLEPAIIRERPE